MRVSPHAVLQKRPFASPPIAPQARPGHPPGGGGAGFQAKPVTKERLTRRRVAFCRTRCVHAHDRANAHATCDRGIEAERARYANRQGRSRPVASDHGCRNRHPLPPGRGRRVRLRLSGRRGPQHLRRAVQAGQGQARTRPPRAGRRARRRRLFALVAQGRRLPRDVGSGRHQCGHRHRDRVHGFDPDGRADRPGARRTRSARTRSRNATPSASRGPASSTTSSSRTWRTSRRRSRRRSTSPQTGRPGPVLVDIPKDVTQATTEYVYPKTRRRCARTTRSPRATPARSRRRCSCCSRRSARWSTRAAA